MTERKQQILNNLVKNQNPNFIVCGHECSGTRWASSLISLHPDAGKVVHMSFPAERVPLRYWHQMDKIDFERKAVVVIVVRDQNIIRLAQQREGYNEGFLPKDTVPEAVRLITSQVKVRVHLWFSYETAMMFKEDYFSDFLIELNLNPIRYPWSKFEVKDANKKYLKEKTQCG